MARTTRRRRPEEIYEGWAEMTPEQKAEMLKTAKPAPALKKLPLEKPFTITN